MSDSKSPKGWYSRGYLPHFDAGDARTQFVTCRLFDSLPESLLAKIRKEIEIRKPADIERETIVLAEKYLDAGYGQCFLRKREVAKIVRDSLRKFDGVRYTLKAWVIMPNHSRFLLRPLPGHSLEKIVQSLKSYTALQSNRALKRDGQFWMREMSDRYIRDADHFSRAFRYIENNPVKSGLCKVPEDWEFSSAWERRQLPDSGEI